MDKKYRETGNNAYLYLKYDYQLELAINLFCWNKIRCNEPFDKSLFEFMMLGGSGKAEYLELFAECYSFLKELRKTKNPIDKFLRRKTSGLDHSEGFYKMIELEKKYGKGVIKDVFYGKYDEEFEASLKF